MEAGLIASIFIFGWGLLLEGAAAADHSHSLHVGGLVVMIVALVGVILSIGGHKFGAAPSSALTKNCRSRASLDLQLTPDGT